VQRFEDTFETFLSEASGVVLLDAGLSDYEAMHETQRAIVDKKRRSQVSYDYLIFVEHPDVFTYGRKSKDFPEGDQGSGSLHYAVERGGEVTFHNPGQLVCYPILSLHPGERDLHLHLRRLEATLIDVLADFSLEGERRDGATGVWLKGKEKKIASIGVAFSGWITYHGSALNVSNDLSGFAKIRPCGFPSEVMTSLEAELGRNCPGLGEVKESFLRHFCQHFHRSLLV
jgi:lipoyl(octanoyl) transferase